MNFVRKIMGREVQNALVSCLRFLPDDTYLKLIYRLKVGKKLNLDNPRTYTEKIQWLKIHDWKPIYTTMVDKYEAKKYIESIIGSGHTIPTLGIVNTFDEIDFEKLPERFVLKCTHDSGGLVICKDKNKLDKKEASRKINKSLNLNFFP